MATTNSLGQAVVSNSSISNQNQYVLFPRSDALPPGWTEHKAPTGHSYYHHAATKQSTYTRPTITATITQPIENTYSPRAHPQHTGLQPQRKQLVSDVPKRKRSIPDAHPWILITTVMGRQFVHNPESKISLWQPPRDVHEALKAMPKLRYKQDTVTTARNRSFGPFEQLSHQAQQSTEEGSEPAAQIPGDNSSTAAGLKRPHSVTIPDEEDAQEEENYEEDYEEESDEETPNEKRQKTDNPTGAVEFTEDDIAWQLDALAQEHGLDDEDLEETNELTPEDSVHIFKEMLDEHEINPYSTWDLEYPKIVDDPRYTVVSTGKQRQVVFTGWCVERIAMAKAEKEKAKRLNPRIGFWDFLIQNASPKLFWPEFKRKFKKSPEMRDLKLTDKEREKMYRDFISYTKHSPSVMENDLKKLLKSTSGLTKQMSMSDLPESILIDVRYVTYPAGDHPSLPPRNQVIRQYLMTLPDAVDSNESEEQQRKEKALKEREHQVRREQWRLRGEIERGKELLQHEEREIERAKNISRRSLISHLEESAPK